MAEGQNQRSLVFQISNKTWNTTLKLHRWDNDPHMPQLTPALPSGSSDSSFISSTSNALGLGWLVVYEADSFTLAIFFFLPKRPELTPKMLQLELSQDKAHLGNFPENFARMALKQDPPNPEQTAVSRAEFSGRRSVSVWLFAGRFKVSATVSRRPTPLLEVELEERDPWSW